MRGMTIGVFGLALTGAACTTDLATAPRVVASAVPFEFGDAIQRTSATATARVIATLKTPNGNTVEFIDLGEGVAIGERSTGSAPASVIAAAVREHATPLEVFMALTPATSAPDALVRDHLARGSSRRAVLSTTNVQSRVRIASSGLETPGKGFYACDDPLYQQWTTEWPASFVGITKYRAANYTHQLNGSFAFYPGAPVYYGTNTNNITFLGSCNGSFNNLTMQIDQRIHGAWATISTQVLTLNEKYTFYSAVPSGYRAVLRSPRFLPVEHYGYGAAWTLTPPKATP